MWWPRDASGSGTECREGLSNVLPHLTVERPILSEPIFPIDVSLAVDLPARIIDKGDQHTRATQVLPYRRNAQTCLRALNL